MFDDISSQMTVGEFAKRSGIAVSTVHFYEAKGLITGSRTKGNQRRFARSDLRRLAVIRIAQQAGIPLAMIKAHFNRMPATMSTTDWQCLAKSWRVLLDERITSLLQLRDQLESCIGCGCLSLPDCPLRNPSDALADQGSGPRLLTGSHRKQSCNPL